MLTNIESYKEREVKVMLPVKVYRNLHKSAANGAPTYSVMQDGLVVAHASGIALTGVQFIVNAAGREKVLREKRKNVHAFVTGYVARECPPYTLRASYNPYKAGNFQIAPNFAIQSAAGAYVGPEGVLISLSEII